MTIEHLKDQDLSSKAEDIDGRSSSVIGVLHELVGGEKLEPECQTHEIQIPENLRDHLRILEGSVLKGQNLFENLIILIEEDQRGRKKDPPAWSVAEQELLLEDVVTIDEGKDVDPTTQKNSVGDEIKPLKNILSDIVLLEVEGKEASESNKERKVVVNVVSTLGVKAQRQCAQGKSERVKPMIKDLTHRTLLTGISCMFSINIVKSNVHEVEYTNNQWVPGVNRSLEPTSVEDPGM